MKKSSQKIIAGVLSVVLIAQVFFLIPTKTAQAISIDDAAKSLTGAIVGCAVGIGLQAIGATTSTAESAAAAALSVSVVDVVGNAHLGAVAGGTAAITNVQTCLNALGKAAAQLVLKEITAETVNWINSGFKGQPLFVKNPGSFFKSIADEEIGKFSVTISDSTKYPFGKDFLKSYLLAAKAGFAGNAQYSLDKVLAQGNGGVDVHASLKFVDGGDFTQGGWTGWEALTQSPQNNPIGFGLLAGDQLGFQLSGTVQSPADVVHSQLNQSLGFLTPSVCVDPRNYEDPSKDTSFTLSSATAQASQDYSTSTDSYDPTQAAKDWLAKHVCKRWETTTPGGVIANQISATLNVPKDSLINANDLNSDIQAIMDALLNQLFDKGLSSLTDTSSNTKVYDNNNSTGQGDNSNSTNSSGSSWNNNNPVGPNSYVQQNQGNNPYPNFVWPDDLPKVIADQTAYVDALKNQNKTTHDLIREIYELDFCVPGPHPGWENNFQQGTQSIINSLQSQVPQGSGATQDVMFQIISGLFYQVFGVPAHFNSTTPHVGLAGQDIVKAYMSSIDDQNGDFAFQNNTSIAPDSKAWFNKIDSYKQKINDNENSILTYNSLIRRLGYLQDEAKVQTDIIKQYGGPQTGPTNPNISMSPQVDAAQQQLAVLNKTFNRIYKELVNSDIVKQANDETQGMIDDIADISSSSRPDSLLSICIKETIPTSSNPTTYVVHPFRTPYIDTTNPDIDAQHWVHPATVSFNHLTFYYPTISTFLPYYYMYTYQPINSDPNLHAISVGSNTNFNDTSNNMPYGPIGPDLLTGPHRTGFSILEQKTGTW